MVTVDKPYLKKTLHRLAVEKTKWAAGLPQRGRAAEFERFSTDQFWRFQGRQLARIYNDAATHVPFYRDQPGAYPRAISAGDEPLTALGTLPILDKNLVRMQPERFWREPALFSPGEHSTGGSSGSGTLRIRADLHARGLTNAILESQYHRMSGVRRPRILRLTGFVEHSETPAHPVWRIPGTRYAYLSIYAIGERYRDDIVRMFQTFRPQIIHGFPSAVHQLALFFKDTGLPSGISPFIVISTSETLTIEWRQDIETHLAAKVFDEYGSEEGQHLAHECEHGAMHIHPGRGIVEILQLDGDEPAKAGELGRVVVTGLVNRQMPLIRYDIGDTAISTSYASECPCGRHWPTIGAVYGRLEDLVRTRDGRQFHLMTLRSVPNVSEAQIVQKGYDRFLYRAVLDDPGNPRFDDLQASVTEQIRSRVHERVTVEFEYVDRIERTTRGKFRAFIVDMDE